MTVCIAGLFDWSYGRSGDDFMIGRAGILISDRMITAGDVQYEPQQRKVAHVAPNCLVAIAGEYSLHSQALKNLYQQLRGNQHPDPYNVAVIYGRAIQAIKRQQAEDLYLAPLGLNTDSFLAQQKEMSDGLTNALLERMQSYRGEDVEAIVLGVSHPTGALQAAAQIYTIDSGGTVSCADDVGFAAIGIGAWHAKSRLMQGGYTNIWNFSPAIAALYAAKRAAEVAPGVGRSTDIQIITKDGNFPLWPNIHQRLVELYDEFVGGREQLAREAVSRLNESLGEVRSENRANAEAQRPAGENPQINGGTNSPAAETARPNEARQNDKD